MPPYQSFVSLPGLSCCRVAISPTQQVPHIASLILADSSHVLRPLMQRRYENVLDRSKHWRQEGLQLIVTGNVLGKSRKRVVRNWARRRVEHALIDKLRERGFDGNGRSLLRGQATSAVAPQSQSCIRLDTLEPLVGGQGDLRGYVNVQLLESILETKAIDLQQQAGLIVNEVLRRCHGGNPKDHRGDPAREN